MECQLPELCIFIILFLNVEASMRDWVKYISTILNELTNSGDPYQVIL